MGEDITKDLPNDESKLDQILRLLQGMDVRLTALEEKVDARLKETRPIWESVDLRLQALAKQVQQGFDNTNRRIGVLSNDINSVTRRCA